MIKVDDLLPCRHHVVARSSFLNSCKIQETSVKVNFAYTEMSNCFDNILVCNESVSDVVTVVGKAIAVNDNLGHFVSQGKPLPRQGAQGGYNQHS